MAQSGFTPISIYYSSTASAVPTAGNLVAGELAINTADGRLFYKDNSGVVQTIASKATGTVAGSTTQVIYNNAGAYAGSANFTFNGTTVTIANDASISGLTVGKGGGAVTTNTTVGRTAGNTNTTGSENTFIGDRAGYTNSTGIRNTVLGSQALYSAEANNNTAIGWAALNATTSGGSNTAVGQGSLQSNTTASNNTAVGYQAGYSNTTGTYNTFLGRQAGYSTTGSDCTFVGNGAGYYTTGNNNTLIGDSAGFQITTGAKNTVLGMFPGNQGGLDIRTASNALVLSDGDGNPRAYQGGGAWFWNVTDQTGSAAVYDGAQFYAKPDNTTKCGYPSYRWTTVYATTGTINTSDANTKQQIRSLDEAELAVAKRIKGLIKAFKFNDAVEAKGDGARIHIGVIAQEVQAAFVAESLDPAKYAMFCSDTWYEVDGKAGLPHEPYTAETPNAVEVTRLGVRYEQLLAFVIGAL